MKLIVDAQLQNLKNSELFDLFRNNGLIIINALNRSSFVELSNEG